MTFSIFQIRRRGITQHSKTDQSWKNEIHHRGTRVRYFRKVKFSSAEQQEEFEHQE